MKQQYVGLEDIDMAATVAANTIMAHLNMDYGIKLYPIPRGGVPAAYAIASHLNGAVIVSNADEAHVIVDDLIDSGATKRRSQLTYPDTPFVALFDKGEEYTTRGKDVWLVMPWEHNDTYSADDIPTRLLQYVGEDPARGGLKETPARYLKAWKHFTSGYDKDPADILKVFEDGAENYNEMVLVRDIPVYSQCEHHLVPFFGVAHVAYIPSGRIVGLSKLSRVVDLFARRLQVQERLTNQIAAALWEHLEPEGVGVVLQCRHICMEARGIAQQGHTTVTSAMQGAFMDNQATRDEFMGLIR